MKKDVFLAVATGVILIAILSSMSQGRFVFKLILGVMIVGLFLYKQLKPYRHALGVQHVKWFSYIERVYDQVFKFVVVKPARIGNALSIDLSALLVLAILLLIIIVI
jgi:hypothetical protein